MVKNSDKMLLYIGDETFAVDVNMVAGIAEAERVFLLPIFQNPLSAKSGFVKGVVSRREDVIVVVDIGSLWKISHLSDEMPNRIAVIKKDACTLGICMGNKEPSFLWKEQLANLEFKPSSEEYTLGFIDLSGKNIRIIDWQKICEEMQRLLS